MIDTCDFDGPIERRKHRSEAARHAYFRRHATTMIFTIDGKPYVSIDFGASARRARY